MSVQPSPSNQQFSDAMKQRTKAFALRVVKLVDSLPKTPSGREIGKQLLRSGMSVGANYRAACRGRSKAEFCSKLGIVEEEADETIFWMELLAESGLVKARQLAPLMAEGNEILKIAVSSIRTAKNREASSQRKN